MTKETANLEHPIFTGINEEGKIQFCYTWKDANRMYWRLIGMQEGGVATWCEDDSPSQDYRFSLSLQISMHGEGDWTTCGYTITDYITCMDGLPNKRALALEVGAMLSPITLDVLVNSKVSYNGKY